VPRTPQQVFSASIQGNDDGVGVAEDATNGRGRKESRERVEVAESRGDGHTTIVTVFLGREMIEIPRIIGNSSVQRPKVSHTNPLGAAFHSRPLARFMNSLAE